MKWLFRKFFNWVMSETPVPPTHVDKSYPFRHHSASSIQFSVVRAENGILLQTYDYAKDMPQYWILSEDMSVGQMVDTVLVERRLAK